MPHTNEEIISNQLRKEALDKSLLEYAKAYAFDYMDIVQERPVFPTPEAIRGLNIFREPLNTEPGDPHEILKMLHQNGSPATVAQTGGRYFGFVNGGIIPAALAAKWLVDTWDQNAAAYAASPVTSVMEDICEKWLVSLFGLPDETAAGFVGGSSTATLCGLAAGRNALLLQNGYDIVKMGTFGAPEVRVVLGEGAHSTVYKALSILGFGSDRLIKIPMDEQGRICADLVPELDDMTLLILQAGNVNTGAFDNFEPLCQKARIAGAWTHIDGAFGLWAAAAEKQRYLTKGFELADSWSADAHKTLNAPYDNGIILCRDRSALLRALRMTGSYIMPSSNRDGMHYTLDMSRRARAVELWASLKSLGKRGVSELIGDLCDKAAYFAEKLGENGFTIHNQVVFNQVLVSFGESETTESILKYIQDSGECWCGGSKWQDRSVIRISVCSYRTTYEDIDRCVKAFVNARNQTV